MSTSPPNNNNNNNGDGPNGGSATPPVTSLKDKLARKKEKAAADALAATKSSPSSPATPPKPITASKPPPATDEPPTKKPPVAAATSHHFTNHQQFHHEGRRVWVRDEEEAWVEGVVVDEHDNTNSPAAATTTTTPTTPTRFVSVSISPTVPPTPFKVDDGTGESDDIKTRNVFEDAEVRGYQDVNDLTRLTHLHEPEILQALVVRYNANTIYTNTGPILIAVNPFKPLSIYTGEHIARYYTTGLADANEASQLPPHVFSVADSAFRNLQDLKGEGRMNQSILVSGESGAGKTETTKFVMSYLATVARSEGSVESKSMETGVADRILESNPILESFGNARTIRNDNSSRFGKFIQMNFDSNKAHGNLVLVGAQILTYLLEKVRLVGQQDGERNFHVFYQMCRGASDEERTRWMLPDIETSRFTSSSGVFDRRDGVKDEDQYARTDKAFTTMKFNVQEREDIYVVTSAVMNLGDVTFSSHGTNGDAEMEDMNGAAVNAVCKLLAVDVKAFATAMTTRVISTHGESYVKGLDVEGASNARDALAKTVYSRLFDFIVRRVNIAVAQSEGSTKTKTAATKAATANSNFIAVLDIFGFEVFKNNSFEQLCINYANETLQQQFNQFVFKLEQQEYEREAIQWSFIEFPDNQPTLDLIEAKPTGLLALLDEQCLFPQGNDEALARKFYDVFKDSTLLTASKADRVEHRFAVKHYAGEVVYASKGFCVKNKDELREEALNLMRSSTSGFVRDVLFPAIVTSEAADKKKRTSGSIQAETLGSQFKSQLASLLRTIKATSPHYVRCLKPNDENVPDKITRPRLVDQLRYGGVLEAVKVARAGYPTRYVLKDFVRRYFMLVAGRNGATTTSNRLKETPESCDTVFMNLDLKRVVDYQIGKTKIFMRKSAFECLETRRSACMKLAASHVQAVCRGVLARKRFRAVRSSTLIAQRLIRGFLGRRHAQRVRENKAAIMLQAVGRRYLSRIFVVRMKRGALCVQKLWRRLVASRIVKEMRRFARARTIQCFFRRSRERRAFLQKKHDATVVQTAWRARAARMLLKRLRVEAKEVGNLQVKLNEKDHLIAELRAQLTAPPPSKIVDTTTQRDMVEKLSFELLAAKAEAERMAGERDQAKMFLEQLQSATPSVPVSKDEPGEVMAVGSQAMMIRDLQTLLAQSQDELRNVAAERDSLAALSLSNEHPSTMMVEDPRLDDLRKELSDTKAALMSITSERDDLKTLSASNDVTATMETMLKEARDETAQAVRERNDAQHELREVKQAWQSSQQLCVSLQQQVDEAKQEATRLAAERDSLSVILATETMESPNSPKKRVIVSPPTMNGTSDDASSPNNSTIAELNLRVDELLTMNATLKESLAQYSQQETPVVVLGDGTRAVTRETYLEVVGERDRLALLLAQQEGGGGISSTATTTTSNGNTGRKDSEPKTPLVNAATARQDLLRNRIKELEMEVKDFQVHKNQIVEHLMQATNEANQKDNEIRTLKRVQLDLQEKLGAMEQLAEQTSGVKIALARRLEGLIIENRTMKQSLQEAQEQLAATQDISRILNQELEQQTIALQTEKTVAAKLKAVIEGERNGGGGADDDMVVTL